MDHSGRIVGLNQQAELMFGYPRHALFGQPIDTLIPERFRQQHPAHGAAYAAHPRVRPMGAGLDLFASHRDGSEFPVDIMLSPVELDGLFFTSVVVRDISSRKANDAAFRRSEERLRSLFEFSPDAIVVTDSQGLIEEVNAQTENLFGYSRGEIFGQPIETLIPERFRKSHPQRRADYAASPRVRAMGAGLGFRAPQRRQRISRRYHAWPALRSARPSCP